MTETEGIVAAVPIRYRSLYTRALAGTLSPRQAIKVKCFECCGWSRFDGGMDRIAGCTVRRCPLYAYRPFQDARESLQGPEGEGYSAEVAPGMAQAVPTPAVRP